LYVHNVKPERYFQAIKLTCDCDVDGSATSNLKHDLLMAGRGEVSAGEAALFCAVMAMAAKPGDCKKNQRLTFYMCLLVIIT
jgi:hypothetical protein